MKNQTPEILERFYDFLLLLMQKTSRFPKSHRYLLGEKIELLSFSILENFLEAIYSKDKLSVLLRINLQLEKLRYFLRLSKDLKILEMKSFENLTHKLYEIGNQLGGWIKHVRSKP